MRHRMRRAGRGAAVLAGAWLAAAGAARADSPAQCQRTGTAAAYLHADPQWLASLLGPPPEPGSDAQRRDLEGVLSLQAAARGTARREQAIADAQGSCARFADALGAPLPEAVLGFLDRAAWQAAGYVGAAKRHFARLRPYAADARVERLADIATTGGDNDRMSYPSGHATLGAACGLLLAGMVPERGAALVERGIAYGESREIVGAHYPRDVQAGRIAGTLAVAGMQQDACFQEDYAQARRALRLALKLPE